MTEMTTLPTTAEPMPCTAKLSTSSAVRRRLAPLITTVQPSVVSIQARSRTGGGIGSGFIISADGLVVTNHHVVAGSDKFEVRLQDGRRFQASVVGSEPSCEKVSTPSIWHCLSSSLRILFID